MSMDTTEDGRIPQSKCEYQRQGINEGLFCIGRDTMVVCGLQSKEAILFSIDGTTANEEFCTNGEILLGSAFLHCGI